MLTGSECVESQWYDDILPSVPCFIAATLDGDFQTITKMFWVCVRACVYILRLFIYFMGASRVFIVMICDLQIKLSWNVIPFLCFQNLPFMKRTFLSPFSYTAEYSFSRKNIYSYLINNMVACFDLFWIFAVLLRLNAIYFAVVSDKQLVYMCNPPTPKNHGQK